MPQRLSLFTLGCLALSCSAAATQSPDLRESENGGATGSAGDGATGGSGNASTTSGGQPSGSGGQLNGAAGAKSGAAGSTSGGGSTGHAGSGGTTTGTAGSIASAGAGNTGPVTVGLPFTEDWESGMSAPKLWTAVADQVPDAANTDWSVVSDDTGKAAQLSSDGTERFLVGGNGSWTDQKLELRVQVVSGSPEIDIAFRYHALKEYYYLELANAHFKVRDRTGANSDILPTGTKPAITTGTWYKVTLQIRGTAVSASLNDMVVASGDFATMPIAAGGIAIGVGSGSGVVQFDDIHVSLP